MKKTILALAIIIGISGVANAQTSSKDVKKQKQKMEMKDHVCTSACKDGKHVYAHGEKGHKCSKECKKNVFVKANGNERPCLYRSV